MNELSRLKDIIARLKLVKLSNNKLLISGLKLDIMEQQNQPTINILSFFDHSKTL